MKTQSNKMTYGGYLFYGSVTRELGTAVENALKTWLRVLLKPSGYIYLINLTPKESVRNHFSNLLVANNCIVKHVKKVN